MPEIEIRPATQEDLQKFMLMDHAYATQYVWQMDRSVEGSQTNVRFHEVRLPRQVRVDYPRPAGALAERGSECILMLAAILDSVPVGYLGLGRVAETNSSCVVDLAIKPELRRQGIGSALLLSAQAWSSTHGLRSLILEMQSKNFPMICLARKLGFEFCGYRDDYFPSHDIALFFARALK